MAWRAKNSTAIINFLKRNNIDKPSPEKNVPSFTIAKISIKLEEFRSCKNLSIIFSTAFAISHECLEDK